MLAAFKVSEQTVEGNQNLCNVNFVYRRDIIVYFLYVKKMHIWMRAQA